MTPHEAARLYAALGWFVLPLHTPDASGVCDCPKREACGRNTGKHPRVRNGLDDASTDAAAIDRWWDIWPHANVGIDLARSGLVDVAPDSFEYWSEFTARGLPPTLKFASGGGSGHEHFLFARSADCPMHRITETGQFDILSNGYAVAPPSLHRSGQRYAWLSPEEPRQLIAGPTEPQPDWVLNMLRAKAQPVATATAERGMWTADGRWKAEGPPVEMRGEALERWYGRVYDTNPETGQIDRSYSLWSLAVALLGHGCSLPFVADLIAERDSTLGWTKFTGRRDAMTRYWVIADRAAASMGPKRARLNGHVPTVNGHVGSGKAPPAPLAWLTAAQIADMEDEAITWHAYGLLGGGLITELDGKVKQSGKTTLALAMVRSILAGQEFLGLETVYAPIVYLSEQSGPSFKRNLKRAGLLGRADLHVLLWNRAIGQRWDYVVDQARLRAREVGAKVLIVDTLSQWSGIRGDSENSSGAAMVVMEPVQQAAADGLAVLLCRHDRKSGGDVGDSGRGSSAYAGAVDVVMHLQRTPAGLGHERQRLLEGISRFEETPTNLMIELGPNEPYEYAALGDATLLRRQVLRREVLASLPMNPDDALGTRELLQMVNGRNEDILKALRELVAEGVVCKIAIGNRVRYYQRDLGADDDD
jgi:hypothetical protein